jgi:hypothetical protein
VLRVVQRSDVVEYVRQGRIPASALLFVVLRQSRAKGPFQVPMQGYYRGSLPESGVQAWRDLR